MAVPFRKVSKTRKRMRRTHYKITANDTIKCPNCGADIKSHRVCGQCGFYKGKKVVGKEDVVVSKKEPVVSKKEASVAKKPKAKKEVAK